MKIEDVACRGNYCKRDVSNQKCENTGDAETVVADVNECYQRAFDNGAGFFSFYAEKKFCFYSTTCDTPRRNTGWPWNIYYMGSGLKSLQSINLALKKALNAALK